MLKKILFFFVTITLLAIASFDNENVQAVTPGNVQKVVSTNCECWCGLEGRGAKPQGTETSQDSCNVNCADRGEKFLACSMTGDRSSPHTNLRCWDAEQCIKAMGHTSDKTPAECMPSFVYCYPNDRPIKLTLSIDGTDEVNGMGDYIKVVYQWLLGVAAVLAVVMIIIGAVKYMLAGGSPNGVKEARKDIFNALTGVAILLCTYLILATINPQLLSLRMPSLPMVRTVETPGAANTCENYEKTNYKVTAANKNCGSIGEVTTGPSGESMPDNTQCTYRTCPEPNSVGNENKSECFINDEDSSKSKCNPCEEFQNLDGYYPKPSSAFCGSFKYNSVGTLHTRCIYFPEKRAMVTALTEIADRQYGYCGRLEINCSSVKSCEDYGELNPKLAQGQDFGFNLYQIANTSEGLLSALLPSLNPAEIVADVANTALQLAAREIISNPDPLREICEMDVCSLNCKFEDKGKSILTGDNYSCVSK